VSPARLPRVQSLTVFQALQIFETLQKVGRNHSFSAGLVIGGKDLKAEQSRKICLTSFLSTLFSLELTPCRGVCGPAVSCGHSLVPDIGRMNILVCTPGRLLQRNARSSLFLFLA
jgi:hypothetical protein